ncbi:S-layer homology domain-containing protein [Ureibacillus aquaedulcis]|uniref:S-layer homology domain-containing protein n=1 Tax=Ureibacillus aquaedulcis TaxID=3058421 RepID=A0ABT8GTM3_9BACL|nr:S-layer homology domain-containing protein [Ureibacillus sp. BA0131]MDN4494753.1 S-layer homology domain-containing protein [Ureibacillus sp. BA0131]
MKKFLGIIILCCLAVGLQSNALAANSSVEGLSNKQVSGFPDVKANHFAYEAVAWANEQGIVSGYKNGEFGPADKVTEAQFAAMLKDFFNLESVNNTQQKNSKPTEHWSDEAYYSLAAYGVPLNGYAEQSIRNQPVKRGEVAQALVYLAHDDLDLTQSIDFLLDHKISKGQNIGQKNDVLRYFGSENELTRAEAVTFLYNMTGQHLDEVSEVASSTYQENKDSSFDELVKKEEAIVDTDLNKVTEDEAKEIVGELMSGIVETFNRLGEEHNWSFDNPPDFKILRPELLNYASEDFTDGFLKTVKDEFFCSCDMPPYPQENLDIQFTLHENTGDRFVASSIELDNMISSGSTIYYTVVKENGKWVMDHYKWVSVEEEPVNLSWEEIKPYLDQQGQKVELLKTAQDNGEKIYIYKYVDQDIIMGIYANNSGHLWNVPAELYPQ